MTSITTGVDGDHFTMDQLTGKCDQKSPHTHNNRHYPEITIIKLLYNYTMIHQLTKTLFNCD